MDEHILYTREDFTNEEILRKNILAVRVIEQGLSICKQCGQSGDKLQNPCIINWEEKQIEKQRSRETICYW